jgi:hypothetical protein
MVLEMPKYCYHFFKEIRNYNIILALSEKRERERESSAVDLWNVLGHFGIDILNSLNAVKNMIKECLPLNFIPMKFKELTADEC